MVTLRNSNAEELIVTVPPGATVVDESISLVIVKPANVGVVPTVKLVKLTSLVVLSSLVNLNTPCDWGATVSNDLSTFDNTPLKRLISVPVAVMLVPPNLSSGVYIKPLELIALAVIVVVTFKFAIVNIPLALIFVALIVGIWPKDPVKPVIVPLAVILFEAVMSPTNVNPFPALPVTILSVIIFKLALILLPVIFVDLIFVDVNNVVDIPSEDVTLPIIRLPLELTFPAIVMSALDIKLDALTLPDINWTPPSFKFNWESIKSAYCPCVGISPCWK